MPAGHSALQDANIAGCFAFFKLRLNSEMGNQSDEAVCLVKKGVTIFDTAEHKCKKKTG